MIGLLKELKRYIEKEIKGRQDIPENVKIHEGKLPKKTSANLDNTPFILLKPMGASTNKEKMEAEIFIIVGITSADENAWRDIISLTEHIAYTFLRNDIIGGKYEVDNNIDFEFYEDSTPKYFSAIGIKVTWITPFLENGLEVIYD